MGVEYVFSPAEGPLDAWSQREARILETLAGVRHRGADGRLAVYRLLGASRCSCRAAPPAPARAPSAVSATANRLQRERGRHVLAQVLLVALLGPRGRRGRGHAAARPLHGRHAGPRRRLRRSRFEVTPAACWTSRRAGSGSERRPARRPAHRAGVHSAHVAATTLPGPLRPPHRRDPGGLLHRRLLQRRHARARGQGPAPPRHHAGLPEARRHRARRHGRGAGRAAPVRGALRGDGTGVCGGTAGRTSRCTPSATATNSPPGRRCSPSRATTASSRTSRRCTSACSPAHAHQQQRAPRRGRRRRQADPVLPGPLRPLGCRPATGTPRTSAERSV